MTTLLTSRNTAPPRMGTCTKAAYHRCAPTLAAVHPQILRRLPAVARLALLREGEGHSAGLHAKVVEFLQAREPYLCTLRSSRAGPSRAGPGRAGPGRAESATVSETCGSGRSTYAAGAELCTCPTSEGADEPLAGRPGSHFQHPRRGCTAGEPLRLPALD